MFGRGAWIAAAAMVVALVIWIVLASRGPASGRAPVQRPGAPLASDGAGPGGTGSVRVSVAVQPAGGLPEWTVETRDAAGRMRSESGKGEGECVIAPLPAGRLLCIVRAPGFIGGTIRLEIEPDRESVATATLRGLGSVSGTVRCDGAPVSGALVHLTLAPESMRSATDLLPEDRGAGSDQRVESGSDGRYRFDRVLPVQGVSLTASNFDHAPVTAGPVEVKPGEEARVDIALVAGAHLSGRIVDVRGMPSVGTTVNVLRRQQKRAAVLWEDEARARTDEHGRFVTPALTGTGERMLKAWIVVDGVHQVIQHETSPPASGTKDVGTLAPHPGIVQFALEGAAGEPPATLTIAVNGDPPGVGQSVVLGGIPFDQDGRVRVAGLPVGEASYTVMGGDARSFGDAQFRTTGRDMVVKVPELKRPDVKPPPTEQLTVDVGETADPALVVLLADGSMVFGRWIPKGSREPIVEQVAPGVYTLLVCAGDRYGRREVTQVAGKNTRVSIAPDRIGRTVSVLVLDGGKPLPDASISVRGFRRDAKGRGVQWGQTGGDGRVRIRGLPPDVTAMAIIVFREEEGFGRGFPIDVDGVDEATVDLTKYGD